MYQKLIHTLADHSSNINAYYTVGLGLGLYGTICRKDPYSSQCNYVFEYDIFFHYLVLVVQKRVFDFVSDSSESLLGCSICYSQSWKLWFIDKQWLKP